MKYILHRYDLRNLGLGYDVVAEFMYKEDCSKMWLRNVELIPNPEQFFDDVRPITNWKEIAYRPLNKCKYVKELTEKEAFIELL